MEGREGPERLSRARSRPIAECGREGGRTPRRRILVWTTTPWTLVSNVALAVNPELEYLELQKRDGDEHETLIIAASRAAAVLGDDYADSWQTVATLRGTDLAGRSYRRPLDWVDLGTGKNRYRSGEFRLSRGWNGSRAHGAGVRR